MAHDGSDHEAPKKTSWWSVFGNVFLFLILAGVVLRLYFFSGEHQWERPASSPPARSPAPAGTTAAVPSPTPETPSAFDLTQARAQVGLQVAEFRQVRTETETRIEELAGLAQDWDKQASALLNGPEGRRIALKRESVLEAKAILALPRPGKPELDHFRETCKTLSDIAVEAQRDPLKATQFTQTVNAMKQTRAEVQKAYNEYRDGLVTLSRLTLLAPATAPASAPSGVTLKEAIDQIDDERKKAQALELQKVADQAQAAKDKKEVEEAAVRSKRAAIARDPAALKLLDFTGLGRPDTSTSGCWMACWAANAFESPGQFKDYALSALRPQFAGRHYNHNWQMGDDIREEFTRRDKLAQAQFGSSLHELFKIAALSEANQKRFASDESMKKAIERAQAKGNLKDAADWAEVLAKGKKLPPPVYP